MCKKHHDRMVEGRGMLVTVGQAVVCLQRSIDPECIAFG
jgi:hypothetical protein